MDNSPRHDTQLSTRQPVSLARSPSLLQHPRQVAVALADEGIRPAKVLDAVRYWWRWALPGGIVLATICGSIVYALFKPQYQASAWVRIEEHTPYLAFEPQHASDQSKGFVATQIELLRSPMVLGPVVADSQVCTVPELSRQANPLDWLRGEIAVKAVGSSELYTLSFVSSDAQGAALVVNAVLDSYFRLRAAEQGQRVEKVLDILKLEQETRAAQVDLLRKNVREMAKQVTGKDPFQSAPEPPSSLTKPLAELGHRLISAEVEETVLRAKLRVLENINATRRTSVPDGLIEKTIAADAQVLQATQQLADQRSKLSHIAADKPRGKEDPTYQREARRLAQDMHALEDLKRTLRAETRLQLENEQAGAERKSLASLRAELENQAAAKQILQERYDEELKSVKQSTGDSVSLKYKQDELARAEKVLDLIAERIVTLKTEMGAPPRVYQELRAETPSAPVQPLPYRNLFLAIVAGLVAPFALAVVKEHFTHRLSDASFAERAGQLPVLGEIAQLPTRTRKGSARGQKELLAGRVFEESIEALRTNLNLGHVTSSLRTIAVASAVTKEGKTSVSAQLAASFARAASCRVLIIDGDLRDPALHSVFQLRREPGVVDVLSHGCDLLSAIVPSRTPGVDLVPAGALRGSPHKLMANGRWEALLEQIPPDYRFVVIDTPPVLAASEALIMARAADAVVVCTMRDLTRLPQLKSATERMVSAGAKIAGLVFNGTPTGHYAQRYGNYYPYLLD